MLKRMILLLGVVSFTGLLAAASVPTNAAVSVEIREGVPDKLSWDFATPKVTAQYTESAFGFAGVPKKYAKGLVVDRSNPFLLMATGTVKLPAGDYRLLVRSHWAARLFVDGTLLGATEFVKANSSGNESVPDAPVAREPNLRPLPIGHQERIVAAKLDGAPHEFRFEAFVGGQKLRQEIGELSVSVARTGEPFRLLSPTLAVAHSDDGWTKYAASARARLVAMDTTARHDSSAEETKYWKRRHEVARQLNESGVAPGNSIDSLLKVARDARPTDDYAFLRRVTLDTVGVIPTRAEIETFLRDQRPDRRARVIDRLLTDARWADNWVGYWQDVLAENPGILKPQLNNTGPFRWWIYESFVDNKPMDRFATELVMMEGSRLGGAPGGFAMATLNDSPMAAKAHVLGKAFLGVELQCARCHDAPHHPFKQKDVFSVAAMLGKSAQTIPVTSTVPRQERTRRPLIRVTLEPGAKIDPAWPFGNLAPADLPDGTVRNPNDTRERFAALLTSPRNERFAQVMVNRVWKRYMGWALVEPVDDWPENAKASHPEVLNHLARELMTHDYDLKHIARSILDSKAYQRALTPHPGPRPQGGTGKVHAEVAPSPPVGEGWGGGTRRRMTAEQLLDSLFAAVGKEFKSEELNLDLDCRRPITEFLNLGTPHRAWEFTSLSNERDRPALSLPIAQSIIDVLTAFGWRESRQNPTTERDETSTVPQVMLLANGTAGSRITRLSADSAITKLCLEDRSLPDLVRAVFLQVLSRPPTAAESKTFLPLLTPGYNNRRVAMTTASAGAPASKASAVSWSNHLSPEATILKIEQERAARAGDPPTKRLRADWRERMEDMLWALVNSPEFVFVP